MIVTGSAYATLSFSVCTCQDSGPVWGTAALMEKYIANGAAKNISSLDSQMMVPTLTMLGLVREWIRLWSILVEAAVTRSLLPVRPGRWRRGGDLPRVGVPPNGTDQARHIL